MNEPTFTSRLGTYTITFGEPEHLTYVLDHLYQSSRGDLTAEVTVRSTMPGFEGHIHTAKLNLVSTMARKGFAKHLQSRAIGQPKDADFDGMVEVACVRTMRAFREGDPAILMRDAVRPPDAGFISEPLVIGRLPTVWFGDGGTGKSLLALAAAVTIHTGRADFGFAAPPRPMRVAYIDWEMGDWEHRERLRMLMGDEPLPDLLYVHARGAIWDEVERLRRILAEQQVQFVVIDSVGMAVAGVPVETSEAALRFYDAVRSLEVGALCIAHKTKTQQGNTSSEEMPFGSVFWFNGARLIWLLKRVQQEGSDTLSVGFFHKKANVGGRRMPLGYQVAFHANDTITIERGNIEQTPLIDTLSVGKRILIELRNGPMQTSDIAETLGVSTAQVRARLGTLSRQGKVWSPHPGEWVLKADHEPQPISDLRDIREPGELGGDGAVPEPEQAPWYGEHEPDDPEPSG